MPQRWSILAVLLSNGLALCTGAALAQTYQLDHWELKIQDGCSSGDKTSTVAGAVLTLPPIRSDCHPRRATSEVSTLQLDFPAVIDASRPFMLSGRLGGVATPPTQLDAVARGFGSLSVPGHGCPESWIEEKPLTAGRRIEVPFSACRLTPVPGAAEQRFTVRGQVGVGFLESQVTAELSVTAVYLARRAAATPAPAAGPGQAAARDFLITGLACQGDLRETRVPGRIACAGATRGAAVVAWEWHIDGRPVAGRGSPMWADGNALGWHRVGAVAIDQAGRRTAPYSMMIEVTGGDAAAAAPSGQLAIHPAAGAPATVPQLVAPGARVPLPVSTRPATLEARCHQVRSVISYAAALAGPGNQDAGLAYLYALARVVYVRLGCDALTGPSVEPGRRLAQPGGLLEFELMSGGLGLAPQTTGVPTVVKTPSAAVSGSAGSTFTVLTNGSQTVVASISGKVVGATGPGHWQSLAPGQNWVSTAQGFVALPAVGATTTWQGTGPRAGPSQLLEGCILNLQHSQAETMSALGMPAGEAYPVPGGIRQDFERGAVFWDERTRRCTTLPARSTR